MKRLDSILPPPAQRPASSGVRRNTIGNAHVPLGRYNTYYEARVRNLPHLEER